MEKKDERAKDQARLQLEGIKELMLKLKEANNNDDDDTIDQIRQCINEDPLTVEVRSNWHFPGGDSENSEYRILLCTGGPAVQIIGDLDDYNQPDTATLQYQDWFTPWEDYVLETEEDKNILLDYAQCFYFGD